jgi:hypothetical protein
MEIPFCSSCFLLTFAPQILVLTQNKQTQMKKLFTLLFVAGAMSIVACGPSAEEKAKMEAEAKAKMDSLFNSASQSVSTAMDSMATAMPDSTAAAPATEEKK